MPTVEYLNYEAVEDHGWDAYDTDVFAKAAASDLDEPDYGTIEVAEGEFVLQAAEAQGHAWPFSCRAGACANCAAVVVEGDLEMDMQQILSTEEVEEKDIALSCISTVESDEAKIIYNAKHLDFLRDRVIG